jgi:hypothetical protein
MPVQVLLASIGGAAHQQGHCGEGKEQQTLHWVLGSALRLWAVWWGCLGCWEVLTDLVGVAVGVS